MTDSYATCLDRCANCDVPPFLSEDRTAEPDRRWLVACANTTRCPNEVAASTRLEAMLRWNRKQRAMARDA